MPEPDSFGLTLSRGQLHAGRPLPYAGLIAAVLSATGVITDSGGLQKEAFLLGRPCTTLRGETEWPETLVDGWNALAASPSLLGDDAWAGLVGRAAPTTERATPYGDGRAAERIVKLLAERQVAPDPSAAAVLS